VLKSHGKQLVYLDGTHSLSEGNMQVVSLLVKHSTSGKLNKQSKCDSFLVADEGIPVAFAITPSHDTLTYKRFLKKIVKACKGHWKPEAIMCDFEDAMHKGCLEAIPEAIILGCRFHFMQAIVCYCKSKYSITRIVIHVIRSISLLRIKIKR
jgi:hypothetical protein